MLTTSHKIFALDCTTAKLYPANVTFATEPAPNDKKTFRNGRMNKNP